MISLNFGAAVYCQEEECGKLSKIIFNPETWEVTNLVVEKGLLLKKARLFPISVVESTTEEGVYISVPGDSLSDYPEYEETYIETTPEGRELESAAIQGTPYGVETGMPEVPLVKKLYIEGVADHLTPMDKDTPVEAVDSTVGNVYGIVIDAENKLISEVLVHQGTIFVEEFFLSSGAIDRISVKGVFLNMTEDELDELIEYDEERDDYWDRMPVDVDLETDPS